MADYLNETTAALSSDEFVTLEEWLHVWQGIKAQAGRRCDGELNNLARPYS